MKRLDSKDLLILQMYYNQENSGRDKPNLSIEEIRDSVPGVRSVATIHNRLSNLEEHGMIMQPAHKQPRSRRITQHGITELKKEIPQI